MLNVPRLLSVCSLFLCLLAGVAGSSSFAQTPDQTPLDRQLARIDFGVVGVGMFTKDVSGTTQINAQPTLVTLQSSTTLGALVTVRYVKSPYVGFEGNFGYSRYTQNFSNLGGLQNNAQEYTLGYVAHTRDILGVHPFIGGGAGTISFKPTSGGGQGLSTQARAAYYYNVGVENSFFSPHFGLRAQFRQVFFKAPDFQATYLRIDQHTYSLEPGVGFYLKF